MWRRSSAACSSSLPVASDSLVTNINRQGSIIRDAISAKKTITAVSWPYDANIGIGANPKITNPTMLDAADDSKATPVPLDALVIAAALERFLFNSSLNRSVIWIE